MSREETAKKYVSALGQKRGSIALKVYDRWAYACWWFHDLNILCTHQGIKGLPDFMGQRYYERLKHLLWQDIMLTVSRLTDPPRQGAKGRYENLTVQWLPIIFKDLCVDMCSNGAARAAEVCAIYTEIAQLIKDLRKPVKPIRKWRDKFYAHSSLAYALNPAANRLAHVDLEMIKASLEAMRVLVSKVNQYCEGASVGILWEQDATGFRNFAVKVLHLVEGAQFIDKCMDPSGEESFTALETNRRFLRQIGAEASDHEALSRIMDFRESVRRP